MTKKELVVTESGVSSRRNGTGSSRDREGAQEQRSDQRGDQRNKWQSENQSEQHRKEVKQKQEWWQEG